MVCWGGTRGAGLKHCTEMRRRRLQEEEDMRHYTIYYTIPYHTIYHNSMYVACRKKTCATLSFHRSCSEQNSADCRKMRSTIG